MKYILSIDQGTTSTRAIVFDKEGQIIGKAVRNLSQIYPESGWVEHSPRDILASVMGVVSEALTLGKISAKELDSIGITNQRETTVVWEKDSGEPIYNAIVWQCRRTAKYCEKLRKEGREQMLYDKTGLVLDAYFSATKLRWILDNVLGAQKRAEAGELLFGTIDTFIMWHLTSGKTYATDYTNASRTMLFNIHTLDWDDEILKLLNIPRCMLPKVFPSSHFFGECDLKFLGANVPITGCAGDQQAALFGHLCTEKGMVKNTYGTGCFLLMNTGDTPAVSSHGLITTLAAGESLKPDYVLEGSVFVGGAVVQWLRDEMRMIRDAADSEKYALSVPDTNGVYIVPAFVGLGAPHWDPEARGVVTGITRGAKKEHFIRAALESIAYQVFDILHAMEKDIKSQIRSLCVDGGASANNFLMQFQSDILDTCVMRPKVLETTALGACYLAGLKTGYYKNLDEIRKHLHYECKFLPSMTKGDREKLLFGWESSIMKAKLR